MLYKGAYIMDLRKWKIFLSVVDHGNFTRAGEELGYTQSGITQMMKSVEQEVGFPLFHKGHHGVSLTAAGEELLPAIRNLLSADECLNQEISFLKGAKKGTLKIGTYVSCSIHWIPEIIQEFQKEYPEILFDIMEGGEAELADWLENHKVDIGFTSYHLNKTYEFIHVYNDPMYAVFPKGHPFSQYDVIPIEWYQDVPFVVSDYTYGNDVRRILKEADVRPDIKYTTSNDFTVISMVEHNLGITILPSLVLRGLSGNFEKRPLTPACHRDLGMAVSSVKTMSPAMKIFIKYAREYLLD